MKNLLCFSTLFFFSLAAMDYEEGAICLSKLDKITFQNSSNSINRTNKKVRSKNRKPKKMKSKQDREFYNAKSLDNKLFIVGAMGTLALFMMLSCAVIDANNPDEKLIENFLDYILRVIRQ